MNGFQLYKQYMTRAEAAGRGTPAWAYGQLLITAFELVGVTRLFDMLEQADVLGGQLALVYRAKGEGAAPHPCDIELVPTDSTSRLGDPQWSLAPGAGARVQ